MRSMRKGDGRSWPVWMYCGAAVTMAVVSGSLSMAQNQTNSAEVAPAYIDLTGVVRDFREKTVNGGHPDFEQKPDYGFGHYMGNIAESLDADGKPQFVGGGFHVEKQWTDKKGNPIYYKYYSAARGDIVGKAGKTSAGGIQSPLKFKQWFRDAPGVNLSRPLALKLIRSKSGSYVFDDKTDPLYKSKGGFFPIDDQLLGNPGGSPKHNFHFTYELHTEFTYDNAANQMFKFIGDDDVWVYINGKLVIDIGGVHAAVEQYVELNRLGLKDGETYTLDFFFAERHRTQSNFRIETNLKLQNKGVPTITAGYD